VLRKALQRWTSKDSVKWWKTEKGIHEADSFLRRTLNSFYPVERGMPEHIETKYIVKSDLSPVVFYRKKNAQDLKHLLSISNHPAEIVRVRMTSDGYVLEENKL
jgi:hypothetical protein